MKRFNWRWVILGLVIIAGGGGLGRWYTAKYPQWDGSNDLKIAYLADNGMRLVSVSRERKMVNGVTVEANVKTWVPGGYGWYLSDRVKKLLESEKKMDLAASFFFYNFGFEPDKIILTGDINKDQSDWGLMQAIGLSNYLRYRWYLPGLMEKEERISKDLDNNKEVGELMSRDFADNRILSEEVRITVVNSSGVNGLAGWLTSRLEWEGMTVVGLETGESGEGKCLVNMGKEVSKSLTYTRIKKLFDCKETIDGGMGETEVELTLGKDFPKVIKY